MRRRISLYIEDQLVELNEQSFVLFNYTNEDLSNPAVVKNSYSQTVKVPGTANNNRLFAHIFRNDRQTTAGSFNALKKAAFTIYDEKDGILQKGYARLTSWENKNGVITYSVSLFGGLGSFFYALSHNNLDDAWNIGDLLLVHKNLYEADFSLTAAIVKDAWDNIADEQSNWSWFNFAPAYNGLADNFDSKHVYFNSALNERPFHNISRFGNDDGVSYGPKNGNNGGILIELGEEHTEWEVQDLRCYLQRPVVRIKALFEAFADKDYNGGFDVTLDASLNDIEAYTDGWLTLPMLNREDIGDITDFRWIRFFDGTMSPTEFLVSFAKMYGLVFLVDLQHVTIMTRAAFYRWQLGFEIDMSKRIDKNSISVQAVNVESKYYQLANGEAVGEKVTKYNELYKVPYGGIRVATSLEFNTDTKELLDNIAVKDAADVLESSAFFFEREYNSDNSQIFKFPIYEECKYTLYSMDTEEVKELTVNPAVYVTGTTDVNYSLVNKYLDRFPKVQLHGEDNGAEDGGGVILFYRATTYPSRASVSYWHLSDDNADMLDLNGGKPCYDISQSGDSIVSVESIPQFIRGKVVSGKYQVPTVDFAKARELYVGLAYDTSNNAIYEKFWKSYMTDRYDVDSKVMTCKVDLSGMQVGQELFRDFYYYDGALWALNKIKNHSLTTYDLTECEFVKVKDPLNYTE